MKPASTSWSSLSAVALATVVATSAHARDLHHAIGYPSMSIGSDASDMYAEALEAFSGGKLKARAYPLSLLNFPETSDGLRDGVVGSGQDLVDLFSKVGVKAYGM